MSFALGQGEGLEQVRTARKAAVSSHTSNHRFRGHCQAGPEYVPLEALVLLPSSWKGDLLWVYLVIDKRGRWWSDNTGSSCPGLSQLNPIMKTFSDHTPEDGESLASHPGMARELERY